MQVEGRVLLDCREPRQGHDWRNSLALAELFRFLGASIMKGERIAGSVVREQTVLDELRKNT